MRLGTILKSREPDVVGQPPNVTSEGTRWWSKSTILCTMLLLISFVSFGFNSPSYDTKGNDTKKTNTTASTAVTTCAGATVLDPVTLPIASQTIICGATDEINSGNATACGSADYMGGFESLYSLTPTTSGNYNIAIAGQSWTGIFVFQGCPTSGGTCIGNFTDSTSSKNVDVALTAGLEYFIMFDTWPTPDSPCPGTFSIEGPPVTPPNCATALLPANGATSVSRNPSFSWTAATGSPLSYDVYIGTTTPAAFVGNVTTTTYTSPTLLDANTLYYYKVVPKNANGDAIGCIEQSFTTGTNIQYCVPTTTSGCTDGDVIARVILNTLDNNSGTGCPSGTLGYSDYTSDPLLTTTLQAGTSYGCTVFAGQYSEGYAAWIDYNDNGVFETSERIGFSIGTVAGSGTVGVLGSSATFPIVLSCDPPLGTHRLRVRAMFAVNGSAVTPCGDNSYGEVEDYLVTITAADPCPAPFGLTAANITSSTADLSWTIGCAETAWEVAIQAAGSGIPSGAGTPSASTTFNATLLTLATPYEYYVRAVCEEGVVYSDWSGPFLFTTTDIAPACTSLVSPADGATGVAIEAGAAQLTWNAPATSPTEGAATSYNVYFGTTSGALTLIGNLPAPVSGNPTVGITNLLYNQTNFWRIVPVNSGGEAVGPCAEWSFTTEAPPANDVCSGAFDLGALTSPLTDTTTGLANDFLPSCGSTFTTTSPDAFYSISVPNGYTLTIGQTSNGYDSAHTVFYGSCASQTQIVCTDDPDTIVDGPTSQVSWQNTTGNTQTVYWVQDGYSSGSGLYTLAWSLTPPPVVVSSFAPDLICGQAGGDEVVITGSNFSGATDVQFNGISATSFTVDSDTQITAVVPAGNTSGVITVYATPSSNGAASSANSLTVNSFPVVNPITGDTALCMPNTLLLSTTSPGGTWSSSNEAVATVVGGTVTGVTEGTVTISYTVTDNGCTTVVTYDVDVNEPVVISSFTPSQTIVTGNDATFTVVATGTGLTYQWFAFDGSVSYPIDAVFNFAGEVYSGFDTNTLLISGVPADINGLEVFCTVTGTSPCSPESTTPNSILNVGDTGIGSDPANVTLCDGGSTSFTVVRSGDDLEEDITYQWQYNSDNTENWFPLTDATIDGMNFSGSNSSVLLVDSIDLSNDGYRFRAVVTGPANFAVSNPATLTVNEGVSISGQPSSTTVCRITTTANFSVVAAGDVTGIQWQSSPNGVDTWSNVGTGSALSVNVTPATPVGVTYYRAVVSGTSPCSPLNSDVVTLTVQQPTIAVTPSSATYCVPGAAVQLVASGAVSYTWAPTTGLDTATGSTVNASPATTTTYTVTGTDALGCTNTTTVTVTVSNSVTAFATATPDVVCSGAEVQLSSSGIQSFTTSAVSTYNFVPTTGTYSNLSGSATTLPTVLADFAISPAQSIGFNFNYGGTNYTQFRMSSDGYISLNPTATNSGSNNLSSANAAIRPIIAPLWDDLDGRATGGSFAGYELSGTTPNRVLTVEWRNWEWNYASSNPVISFQVKLYETTNTIEFVYRSESGAVNSGSATIGIGAPTGSGNNSYLNLTSVSTPAVSSTSSVTNINTKPATGTVYRFVPSNVPSFTYSWTSNPEGFTSTAQNPVVNPSVNTTYTVVVTASSGCSDSESVAVNITSGASIETQPIAINACQGTNQSLTVVATGPSLLYQWRKDGENVGVASANPTLNLSNVTPANSGSYDVIITPVCGDPITSDAVSVVINPTPVADAVPALTYCVGETTAVINLTGTPVGVVFDVTGGSAIGLADQTDVTAIPSFTAITGNATLTITPKANGCTGAPITVNVLVSGLPQLTLNSSTASVCSVGPGVALVATVPGPGSATVSFGTNLVSDGMAPAIYSGNIAGIPTGATITSAQLQFTNVESINGSYRSEIRVALTGAHTLAATQISTLSSVGVISPNPTVTLPGFAATSGAISLVLTETFNDSFSDPTLVDATFGSAQLVINYTMPSVEITWSPTAGLFTDAALQNAYVADVNSPTVYAFGNATVYTAKATNVYGCESEATVSVSITPATVWYADSDNDGYGVTEETTMACSQPVGYVALGGDCNDAAASINPGALEICFDGIDQNCDDNLMNSCAVITARLRAQNCDTNLTSLNQVVRGDRFSQSIPSGVAVTGYRFRVTNLVTSEVRIVERSNYVFQLTYTDFADYNTPYSVEVALRLNQQWMDAYGAPCTITTPGVPNTVLAPTSCGATVAQMNNIIRAVVVPSALQYEFEVSLIEGAVAVETTTLIKTGESFNLLQLSGISIKFGAEYSVRVKVQVPTSSGPQWSTAYGAPCSVFTPLAVEAAIEGCGVETGIAPAAMTTLIYASPVGGATQYKFTLTDGMAYTQTYTTPSRYFKLSNFNALQALTPGGTYSVTVEVQVYGFYYPGKDCNILVPGGAPIVPFTRADVDSNNPMGEFKAVAYPNPYGESFALNLISNSTSPVSIAIYDMAGRLLETREFKFEKLASQKLGERYPSGVYSIIVNQDEETQTIRVVKK